MTEKEQAVQRMNDAKKAKEFKAEKAKEKAESVKNRVGDMDRQYAKRRESILSLYDPLQLYFEIPYHVDDNIIIYQPKVGDAIIFGDKDQFSERDFYGTINIFCGNPTMYRLQLWDMGLDWNKISDFELFIIMYKGINPFVQDMLFRGTVNFLNMQPYSKNVTVEEGQPPKQEIILYDKDADIEIDEEKYIKISNYIRAIMNIFPKVEKAAGKTTKNWIIEEERTKQERHKDDPPTSLLLPLISQCLNHPGFKYKKNELKEVGFVEFMDAVQRLQVYENTRALLQGSFSGMISTDKIDKNEFNFMRDINHK